MFGKIINFILGLLIISLIYFASVFIIKLLNIPFPAAVLGLILFTLLLSLGVIKESLIKDTVEFFLKNMSLLFVPFIVGLMAYKDILSKNLLCVLLVVLFSTTAAIIFVGLFCEWGLKFLRIHKIKKRDGVK